MTPTPTQTPTNTPIPNGYSPYIFTDCRTSTSSVTFNIIYSAFSLGDIVSYDDGNGTKCYYLTSTSGTSVGLYDYSAPEYMSGDCATCISAYCDSMVAYDFVSCCTGDINNMITYGVYLPNFTAGTEVIIDPDSGDYYHIYSASSRGYSYCFETPNYSSCVAIVVRGSRHNKYLWPQI